MRCWMEARSWMESTAPSCYVLGVTTLSNVLEWTKVQKGSQMVASVVYYAIAVPA